MVRQKVVLIGVAMTAGAAFALDPAPLPPDVQARLAEENAKAALVTEGLGELERPWTVSAYIPDDTILYKVGDRPEALIEVRDAAGGLVPATALSNVLCRIDWNTGDTAETEFVPLSAEGNPLKRVIARDRPGTTFFTASLCLEKIGADGRRVGHPQPLKNVRRNAAGALSKGGLGFRVGAMFDPLEIRPGKPELADFDAKWTALLEKDEAEFAGKSPLMKRLRTTEKNGTQHWLVALDSLGGEVHFEYTVPAAAQRGMKLPLIASFQAYGVACTWAEAWNRWAISIGPNCHSISNFQPNAYYAARAKELGNFGFPTNENDSIETCYHTRMLLRDIRAVRWAQSQPEWNGETITTGGSQGGFQSMAIAGIFPSVKTATGYCPWYVDIGCSDKFWRPKYQPGPAYADPVYWMRRTKAQTVRYLVGIADTACPSAGEMAMFNAIPDTCADAKIYIFQSRGHDVGDQCTYPRVCISKRFGKVTFERFPQGTPGVRADAISHPGWEDIMAKTEDVLKQ